MLLVISIIDTKFCLVSENPVVRRALALSAAIPTHKTRESTLSFIAKKKKLTKGRYALVKREIAVNITHFLLPHCITVSMFDIKKESV